MTDYIINLGRLVNGNQQDLIDQYLTADQAIDLMLYIQENYPAVEHHEADQSEEPEPEPEPTPTSGKKKLCGSCGQPGHNKKTCPKKKYQPKPKPKPHHVSADDRPFYYDTILHRLNDGVAEEDIYDELHDSITDVEYRQGLEWAKQNQI